MLLSYRVIKIFGPGDCHEKKGENLVLWYICITKQLNRDIGKPKVLAIPTIIKIVLTEPPPL